MINYKNSQTAKTIRMLFVCAFLYNFVGCYAPYTIYPLKGDKYDLLIHEKPRVFLSIVLSDLKPIVQPGEVLQNREIDEKVEILNRNVIDELNRILQPQICYPVKVDSIDYNQLNNYVENLVIELDNLNYRYEKLSRIEIRRMYNRGELDSLRKGVLNNLSIDNSIHDYKIKTNNHKYLLVLRINGMYKTRKKQRRDNLENILTGSISGVGRLNMFVINIKNWDVVYYYETKFYHSPLIAIGDVLELAFKEYLYNKKNVK